MATTYKVGYGKPPIETRFRKGVCPNPAGRGKKKPRTELAEIEAVLSSKVSLEQPGTSSSFTWAELTVRHQFSAALRGDVGAAARLLQLHEHGKNTVTGTRIIRIIGGLPPNDAESPSGFDPPACESPVARTET